jgi:hypothetical protein
MAERGESELRKTTHPRRSTRRNRQLMDYHIGELERPFGPHLAWEDLRALQRYRLDRACNLARLPL